MLPAGPSADGGGTSANRSGGTPNPPPLGLVSAAGASRMQEAEPVSWSGAADAHDGAAALQPPLSVAAVASTPCPVVTPGPLVVERVSSSLGAADGGGVWPWLGLAAGPGQDAPAELLQSWPEPCTLPWQGPQPQPLQQQLPVGQINSGTLERLQPHVATINSCKVCNGSLLHGLTTCVHHSCESCVSWLCTQVLHARDPAGYEVACRVQGFNVEEVSIHAWEDGRLLIRATPQVRGMGCYMWRSSATSMQGTYLTPCTSASFSITPNHSVEALHCIRCYSRSLPEAYGVQRPLSDTSSCLVPSGHAQRRRR